MIKKTLSIIFVVAITFSLFTGCAGSNESPEGTSAGGGTTAAAAETERKPVTLKLWHLWAEDTDPESIQARIKEWAKAYGEKNPGITVEAMGNATVDKTLTALSSGDGPDILMNQWPNCATWSDKGALLDLTDYVNNDAGFDKNDIIQAAWDRTTYKDRIYGIPFGIGSSEIFYNKDLLAKAGYTAPPQTMEELVEMAEKLTIQDDKGNIVQLGFLPDYPWLDNVLWPVAFGASWIDKETNKITFDSPEIAAAYQWQVDIYKKYGVEPLTKYKSGFGNEAQDPFISGKLAMMFRAEGQIGTIKKYAPDLNYGIATIPYPASRPDLKGSMFITANVWNISNGSKNKDEAWKALADLTSKEQMKYFSQGIQNSGMLFSRITALEALQSMEVPGELKEVAKMLQGPNVTGFPMVAYINEYLTAINDEMSLCLSLKQPVEQAQKNVVEKMQPLADQNPIK